MWREDLQNIELWTEGSDRRLAGTVPQHDRGAGSAAQWNNRRKANAEISMRRCYDRDACSKPHECPSQSPGETFRPGTVSGPRATDCSGQRADKSPSPESNGHCRHLAMTRLNKRSASRMNCGNDPQEPSDRRASSRLQHHIATIRRPPRVTDWMAVLSAEAGRCQNSKEQKEPQSLSPQASQVLLAPISVRM